MISALILLLCLTGFVIALYFTGVTYKWFGPNVFWIPQICRLDEKSCIQVLETPRARLAGIPNSVFGVFLYLYVVVDLFWFPDWVGLIPVFFAFVRSVYLAYSLVFITKILCLLCFTSHIINLILFIYYLNRTFV